MTTDTTGINLKVYVIHHPNMSESMLVRTVDKAHELIKKNQHIWDRNNIDSDCFIIEDLWIKDRKILNCLYDGMPELFL